MRYLSHIILFAILVGVTAHSSGLLYRVYHEERLAQIVENKLSALDYTDVDVEVEHMYARKVRLARLTTNNRTREEVQNHVFKVVRDFTAVSTDIECIDPKMINISTSKEVGVKPVTSMVVNVSTTIPSPRKSSKPRLEKQSPELRFEWDEKREFITVKGKLASMKYKEEMLGELQTALKSVKLNDQVIVSKEDILLQKELGNYPRAIILLFESSSESGHVNITEGAKKVEITAVLENKLAYQRVLNAFKASGNDFILEIDALSYLPEFSIEKDDDSATVYLRGYADKHGSVNLSSYVKRYTRNKVNGYHFMSEIIQDAKSEAYNWNDSDTELLDHYLSSVIKGKLTFAKGFISEIAGVTNSSDYSKLVAGKFQDTDTLVNVIYDEDLKVGEKVARSQAKHQLAANLLSIDFYFEGTNTSLDEANIQKINKAHSFIKGASDQKSSLIVSGCYEAHGNQRVNQRYGQLRAYAVMKKLELLGVPKERMTIQITPPKSNIGSHLSNRRVEIFVN